MHLGGVSASRLHWQSQAAQADCFSELNSPFLPPFNQLPYSKNIGTEAFGTSWAENDPSKGEMLNSGQETRGGVIDQGCIFQFP